MMLLQCQCAMFTEERVDIAHLILKRSHRSVNIERVLHAALSTGDEHDIKRRVPVRRDILKCKFRLFTQSIARTEIQGPCLLRMYCCGTN